MPDTEQLLRTRVSQDRSGRRTTGREGADLPPGLLQQAAYRLRIVSLVVSAVLLWAWIGNTIEGDLPHELSTPVEWIPNTIMLVASLGVFLLARRSRLSPSGVISLGLVYEVIMSATIPISQYWNAFAGLSGERLTGDLVGMSWVAMWMLFVTVLVPARPAKALLALIPSGAAVPVTVGILIAIGNAPAPPPLDFTFIFVLPYVFAVVFCYVASRVIYGLGHDVQRAQEMGSYHLLERIGRGGMGEVWRARHNLLARPAAIKLVRPDALGSDAQARDAALARFEREAQATAGLQSPHTVELYDFGVSQEGSLYYVMELLAGVDLESLVKRFGPVPAERAVFILQQACHSLGEAHRRGLIHRDIKPSNIVLCERVFRHDFVKVLDFGLVKHVSTLERADAGSLTAPQVVAGTPAYVAPEIALGKTTIDGRADLYALGCVAFWLVTGRRVFEEETPVAMIVAHTTAEPPPPERYAELSLPPALDALILRCLAKDPAKRPDTAEALAAELAAIDLPAPWTEDRAAQWWQSHRPTDGAGGVESRRDPTGGGSIESRTA